MTDTKFSLHDIANKAFKELETARYAKFSKEFERLNNKRVNKNLAAMSTDTIFGQDHATVHMFCVWCAKQEYPVYHVAEGTISIAESFEALYNHEYGR